MNRKGPEVLGQGDKQRDPKVDSGIKLVGGRIFQPHDGAMQVCENQNIAITDQIDMAVMKTPSNFNKAMEIYENILAKLSSGKISCAVDGIGNLSFKEKD